MSALKIQFLGCGDAFGSGGRFNTCIYIRSGALEFLIDCGASAMISVRRFLVDPNAIETILITHLHGDHFGGLPFFVLDAQLVSRRTRPLKIAGPPGVRDRVHALMEAMFPGSSTTRRPFPIEFIELVPGCSLNMAAGKESFDVAPYEVKHPSGSSALALRLTVGGKVVAYTGDTEWVDTLMDAGSYADLLIAEAYTFEKKVPFHLDYLTLSDKLPSLRAKRLVLTHMSPDMLARAPFLPCEAASDGLEIVLE